MDPLDKKLLLRVALRMERSAKETYEAAIKADPKTVDAARRTRDRELGDVSDLKDYVKRAEAETKPIAEHEGAYVMVPETPSVEMIEAGDAVVRERMRFSGADNLVDVSEVYRAMTAGARKL